MSALNNFSNLIMKENSMRNWIFKHEITTQRYIDDHIHPDDHHLAWVEFLKKPSIAMSVITDYMTPNSEKIRAFLDLIFNKSPIIVMHGIRGSGKTALALRIAEWIHIKQPDKPVQIVRSVIQGLPTWIENINDLEEIKQDAYVIVDEGGIFFNPRRSMSTENVQFGELLRISRHKNLTLLFLTQHSMNLDVDAWRMADIFIIKMMSFEERQSTEGRVKGILGIVKYLLPKKQNEFLWSNGSTFFKCKANLPSFWTTKISKSFAQLDLNTAINFVERQLLDNISTEKIIENLNLRGIDKVLASTIIQNVSHNMVKENKINSKQLKQVNKLKCKKCNSFKLTKYGKGRRKDKKTGEFKQTQKYQCENGHIMHVFI